MLAAARWVTPVSRQRSPANRPASTGGAVDRRRRLLAREPLLLRRAARRQAHPGGDGEQVHPHRREGPGRRRSKPPPPGRRHAEGTGGSSKDAREGLHALAPAAGGPGYRTARVLDRQHGLRRGRGREHLAVGTEPADHRASPGAFRRRAGPAPLDPRPSHETPADQVHRRVRQRHRRDRARRQVGPAAAGMPRHHRPRIAGAGEQASSPSSSSSNASASRWARPSSA